MLCLKLKPGERVIVRLPDGQELVVEFVCMRRWQDGPLGGIIGFQGSKETFEIIREEVLRRQEQQE